MLLPNSCIRTKEAVADEDEYWNTHPYARWRRDMKKKLRDKLNKLRGITEDDVQVAGGGK